MLLKQRSLIALASLVTIFTTGLSSAQAAFPGENGLIAYRKGNQIYTVGGDGSNDAAVPNTNAPAGSTEPAWSADGNHLAFIREGDVWVIDASGSGARNLTKTPDFQDAEPTWSPDGTEIAFASVRDSTWEIYAVRSSDGGGERQLTDDTDPARRDSSYFPVWSPDGSTIAFTGDRSDGYGIFTMPADTGEPETHIIDTSVINVFPTWFPDSSKIAYQSAGEIWVANPDGSSQTQVTSGATTYFGLSVSPDGTKFAFMSARTGDYEIFVSDIDGSNQVNITNSPGTDDRMPDWGVPGSGTQQGTDGDDNLSGSDDPDTVHAGDGDDVISTLGGPDVVFGEGGNDTINGGAGNDKLYGDFAPSTVARPSRFGLALQGEEPPVEGDDVLKGGGGDDVAVGGAGDDTLNGGPGVDRLKAGPGEDTCVFSSRKEVAKSSSCEHKKRNFKRNFLP